MADIRSIVQLESIGALTVGVAKDKLVLPFNGELINAAVTVGVAPTGAALVVDLLLNGVTIYTTTANRPTVAISALVGSPANSVLRPDVTKFVAGDVLSLSIITVGSTIAGTDLDVSVQFTST